MAAALSASSARTAVRVQTNTNFSVVTPCVVVRTFQRGRFSVVSWQQICSGDHIQSAVPTQLFDAANRRPSAALLLMSLPQSRRSGRSVSTAPVSAVSVLFGVLVHG